MTAVYMRLEEAHSATPDCLAGFRRWDPEEKEFREGARDKEGM